MNKLKIYERTVKTFFNRHRPYYAHLCITERCNMRCRYCQIWENPLDELSTNDFKKVIDKLERMGIAFLIFTGGEPLLRRDIFELIDHTARTGLVTSITSNGTMSREMYFNLLRTGIDKITISLDGVEGEEIPYSHIGSKILENIEFLNQYRGDKIFTVSTILYEGNKESIPGVVKYCEKNGISLFIQPVVTGIGTLRKEGDKAEPFSLKSPNILNPAFFNKACEEYARVGALEWDALCGQLFFDIKPNGDFWICQDYPTTLNILDPNFERRWKEYDFDSARKQCKNGCIYSCYYLTQKGFEIDKIYPIIRMIRKFKNTTKR